MNLQHLMADGLIRLEGVGTVRVRFFHDADGAIYYKRSLKSPRLRVGRWLAVHQLPLPDAVAEAFVYI